jgi:hypothetical protein
MLEHDGVDLLCQNPVLSGEVLGEDPESLFYPSRSPPRTPYPRTGTTPQKPSENSAEHEEYRRLRVPDPNRDRDHQDRHHR